MVSLRTKKFLKYLVTIGGVVALSILAPQLPYAILRAYFRQKRFNKTKFKADLKRWQRQKMIEWKEIDGQIQIKITENGKKRALRYKFDELFIKKPSDWDKKWRLVVFDIPEKKRLARDVLRAKLKELGFLKIQKSVFIYPYECKEIITLLGEIYEIKPYVRYFIVESTEDNSDLLKFFNLES